MSGTTEHPADPEEIAASRRLGARFRAIVERYTIPTDDDAPAPEQGDDEAAGRDAPREAGQDAPYATEG